MTQVLIDEGILVYNGSIFPPVPDAPSNPTTSSNSDAWVGAVVGTIIGVVAVGVIGAVGYCVYRHRHKDESQLDDILLSDM